MRALRRGWLKPQAERTEAQAPPPIYMLWDDDSTAETARTGAGLTYIPAPKPELPGHEESYNPPAEFLPTDAERAALEEEGDEGRPAFVPRAYDCLRRVPQYARVVHDRFERCLDLYLCPRVRSKRIHCKPEDLVPKEVPKPADLRPFPNKLCITFRGHSSKVLPMPMLEHGLVRCAVPSRHRCLRVLMDRPPYAPASCVLQCPLGPALGLHMHAGMLDGMVLNDLFSCCAGAQCEL